MADASFNKSEADRWFAVEFNNAAWDLVESPSLTPQDRDRLLHVAHAACAHWLAVGNPLNHQRALDLLAHAYASAGHGSLAVHFAGRCAELSRQNQATQTPFDRACSQACMAHALRVAGQIDEADASQQRCAESSKSLDEDERTLLQRLAAMG